MMDRLDLLRSREDVIELEPVIIDDFIHYRFERAGRPDIPYGYSESLTEAKKRVQPKWFKHSVFKEDEE